MWVRLDDAFADHPKLLAAGPLALVIQVRALCYSARHLTDGHIPRAAVASLVMGFEDMAIKQGEDELVVNYSPGLDIDWPGHMVQHGLWDKAAAGYVIHDFLDYQMSRKDILHLRESRKKSGQAGGRARAIANRVASARALLEPPNPNPNPNPKTKAKTSSADASAVIAWLNAKAGRTYRLTGANLEIVKARLAAGIEPWQLKAIVSRKVREWQGDAKMRHYLRPETLFNKTKCEQYLGELPAQPEEEPA